jgi:hypothetical protein
MAKQAFYKYLRIAAVLGNVLFILWILFNAMDSGWKGRPVEIMSGIGLVILLLLNTYFLATKVRFGNPTRNHP